MKFIEVYWFLVDKCRYAYSTLEWFPSAWWMFQCFFPPKNTGKARQAPSKSWSKLVPLVFFMWCFLAYFWTVLGFFPNNSGLKWTKPPNGLVWKWGVASDMSKLIYSMLIKSDKHQHKWRFRIFFVFSEKEKQIDGSAQVSRSLTLPELPHWCLQWLRHHANAPQSARRSRWYVVFVLFGGYRHP